MLHDGVEGRGAEGAPPRLEAVEGAAALRQIEGEIPRGLEDPQLAGALARHAARGHVGHRAVRELDPCVGDVDVGRENRDAGRAHVRHFGAHQLEHEIEIVDHEVEDHRDIGAAGLKRREALRLEEPGLLEIWGGGAHGAVEALHVPDLEDHLPCRGTPHQGVGPRERVRQRLLDEQTAATLQHRQPHTGVGRRRHRHRHRCDAIEQCVERGVGDRFQLTRHLGGPRRIDVVDPHQLVARQSPQQPHMVIAQGSGADDPYAHRPPRHTSTPRWEPSMNRRKCSISGTLGSSERARAIPWLTVRSELNSSR